MNFIDKLSQLVINDAEKQEMNSSDNDLSDSIDLTGTPGLQRIEQQANSVDCRLMRILGVKNKTKETKEDAPLE